MHLDRILRAVAVYDNAEVAAVEQLMKGNDSTDVEQLLRWGDLP